jgi:hypothetical protein
VVKPEGSLGESYTRYETPLLKSLRKRAAYGTGYHLLDPGFASMAISGLAEIINRLWEDATRRPARLGARS